MIIVWFCFPTFDFHVFLQIVLKVSILFLLNICLSFMSLSTVWLVWEKISFWEKLMMIFLFVQFQLTEINDKMSEYTNSISMTSPSAALLHTLQRHRDILQDYHQEFHKTKANITACREREELMGSVKREIDAYKSSSGLNRRTEMYLKENEHIRR